MTDNKNIARISTLEEAREAWEIFFDRFYSSEIPEGVKVEFDPGISEFKPRENKQAKNQSPYTKEGRTDHSDDFDDFLNANTIKIPEIIKLDKNGLKKVKKIIEEGDFSSTAFKKIDHIYYALWLFRQNKISRQQMATILAMWQVGNKQGFKILDSEGNFTTAAKNILIPKLKENFYTRDLTEKELQRFRLLIQAAPKSEQVFYLSDPIKNIFREPEKTLGLALYKNQSWHRIEHQGKLNDLHLFFGSIEALQIAIRGIHGAAANRAVIGIVNPRDVKDAVLYNYRPTAIAIPKSDVELKTKDIHGYTDSPISAVTAHDVFHARLHNTIPPEFHLMLNHMYHVISGHTRQVLSKFLWEIMDREFHYFQKNDVELSINNGAEIFELMLTQNARTRQIFPLRNDQLTDEGIAIIYNMVKENKLWKNRYLVDIDQFSGPYQFYIDKMKKFVKKIEKDCLPELVNFKFRLYCFASNDAEYQYMINLMDDDHLKRELKFIKINQGKHKNNTILASRMFGRILEVNENNIEILISIFIKNNFSEGRKINIDLINSTFEEISGKFKSIRTIDEISEKMLDDALSKFSSLEERLLFLENCHEKIISSENYVRKNPSFDKFFSFMRNPLTASQQKHVSQIYKKIREVVHDHAKNMSDEKGKEFQWQLKMRNSRLGVYENIFVEEYKPGKELARNIRYSGRYGR